MGNGLSPSTLIARPVTGAWSSASRREWLVTNGLGGFAAGTVAGANTRRYHGLLICSFSPPVERVLLLAKLELSVTYEGQRYDLGANEFADGTVAPHGFIHIESFGLQHNTPTWRYAVGDALLEQQIFMAPQANTSYFGLRLLRASATMQVALRPLCAYRDYHHHQRGAQDWQLQAEPRGCTLQAYPSARALRLEINSGRFVAAADWHWNFRHQEEAERGLDFLEDLYAPGTFHGELAAGERLFVSATAESHDTPAPIEVLADHARRCQKLAAALPLRDKAAIPDWISQLTLAADQFVVARDSAGVPGQSIIAGYPWFADWGRDTMIALPGLTTTLQRHAAAAGILRTFARYIDRGMLPNRFPDGGEAPEYNTADATLWFFHALDRHLNATGDSRLALELLPALMDIIQAHCRGTRFGIRVDPSDGLLAAGEPGVQLTWMDAKVGDWVVTPRTGKAVELNALWLNALNVAVQLTRLAGDEAAERLCRELLARGSAGFGRFWNGALGCLFDVIDVDGGNGCDASIRPNQILALSLPYCVLEPQQAAAVLQTCARELVTSFGLRSLSPSDPAYIGRYLGNTETRDRAYHQGTVWSWLLGPFAIAHFRVHGDARQAQSYLEPIAEHLRDACIGSISEIFDGEPPHAARGCFAQAWSVGEILRAWVYLEQHRQAPAKDRT